MLEDRERGASRYSEWTIAVGGAFAECLLFADVYLSPHRIHMPRHEWGLGKHEWQVENHPFGEAGVYNVCWCFYSRSAMLALR